MIKKRLEKALPSKSNLTLKEQMFFIKNTFYSLRNNKIKKVSFYKKRYLGLINNEYGFFEEYSFKGSPDIEFKSNPYLVNSSEIFLEIINSLNILKFNRKFKIETKDRKIILTDLITNESKEFSDPIFLDTDIEIEVNSKFLYIFRLNQKTLSKKNNIYFFETHILIEFKRKNKNILFYINLIT